MDIEASVTGDRLNIGVFAPRFLMDDERAVEVVDEITAVLGGL